jgi:hypothetical protein
VPAFQLAQPDLLERICQLVQNDSLPDRPLLDPLVRLSGELLMYFSISSFSDPYHHNASELLGASITIQLTTEGAQLRYAYSSFDTFLGAEAMFNYNKRGIRNENLIRAFQASPLRELIHLPPNLSDCMLGELGALHRIFETDGWVRMHPKFRTFQLSPNDVILPVLERYQNSLTSPEQFTVELSPNSDNFPLSALPMRNANINQKLLLVLRVLDALHKRVPDLPIEIPAFETRVATSMNSPYLIVTCTLAEIQIVQNFTFLFSFPLREFVVRMTGSDILSALRVYQKRNAAKRFADTHNLLKCEVKRETLFEAGVILLRTIGPTLFHFEAKFVGEEGSGVGPTREFFTQLAKEFGAASRGLWRNPAGGDAPYAADPLGLFPHFSADSDLFFVLGLFCGKALQMGFLVPLPFNPAFFKLVKRERVAIAEVDPAYDMELEGMEGMPFLYPEVPHFL